MSARYQMLERLPVAKGEERNRWQFVAHGARFDKREAEQSKAFKERNGKEVRLIRV